MKKKFTILPVFLMLSSLVGCGGVSNSSTVSNSSIINDAFINHTDGVVPYTQKQSEDGKAAIYNRKQIPQLMLSALLRTDLLINADFLSTDEMEDYFAICKETGLNTIELSVMWSQIEKEYDVYDFTDIKNYLDYAKKYDLKVNIEWYGSFVDGESHSANIPSYVANDEKTYPIIQDLFDFANYGRCRIMDWDNPNLLERESKAIYSLMNYIYEWNLENDNYDPVIMVQIGQGVDRFQRWRINAYKIEDANGSLYNSEEAWKMVQTYVNEVAKGVKYSKYKALTRVEFCEQAAVVNYVRSIKDLENIDVVCPTYLHDISSTKNGIKSFVDEYEDMAVMNVENWASDINYKQILSTIALGGTGYVSYQLSSPNYYPESPNGALYGRYNSEGATLSEKFIQRNTRADDTKQINTALSSAFLPAASAKRSNFAVFGLNNLINNKEGDERIQKIYLNNGLLFEYSNPMDAYGFAIYNSNYVYTFSSKDASLEITNCTIPMAQTGYFDKNGEWVKESDITLENNKKLSMTANEVYRIRISNILELPLQTELNENNFKGTLDSIRG